MFRPLYDAEPEIDRQVRQLEGEGVRGHFKDYRKSWQLHEGGDCEADRRGADQEFSRMRVALRRDIS